MGGGCVQVLRLPSDEDRADDHFGLVFRLRCVPIANFLLLRTPLFYIVSTLYNELCIPKWRGSVALNLVTQVRSKFAPATSARHGSSRHARKSGGKSRRSGKWRSRRVNVTLEVDQEDDTLILRGQRHGSGSVLPHHSHHITQQFCSPSPSLRKVRQVLSFH